MSIHLRSMSKYVPYLKGCGFVRSRDEEFVKMRMSNMINTSQQAKSV